MHHALQIQEILLNIFLACHSLPTNTADLTSLARTCRAFKAPALDVLWKELHDLSPIARCIPAACDCKSPETYFFVRPLTEIERETLRCYTRRIRSILNFGQGLDRKAFEILSDLSYPESVFPNLRYLWCGPDIGRISFLRMTLPSLTSFDAELKYSHRFDDALTSFSKFSPNISNLSINVEYIGAGFADLVSACICQWQNLQVVDCGQISLSTDALVHLSHMPLLTRLSLAPSARRPLSDSPLVWSSLQAMTLNGSMDATVQFLSRTRLPHITDLRTQVHKRPSKQEISSFLAGIDTSKASKSIKKLRLSHLLHARNVDGLSLGLLDLEPCIAFSDLCHLELGIEGKVSLVDRELLALASSWPRLQFLAINAEWGWRTPGITPDGILRLLQTCPLLLKIALAIDTRDYTEVPSSSLLDSLGSMTRGTTIHLDVLDSVIQAESVPAISAFFAHMRSSNVSFRSWSAEYMRRSQDWEVQYARWDDVRKRANGL